MAKAKLGSLGGKRWRRVTAQCAGLVALACGGSAVGSGSDSMGQAGRSAMGVAGREAGQGSDSSGTNVPSNPPLVVGTSGSGNVMVIGGSGGSTSASMGGPVGCVRFTSTESCKAAGCYPALGQLWSRDEAAGGTGAGGEGGAQDEQCTVQQQAFLGCRDISGGGAVNFSGCDPGCNSCATGTNFLPVGWTGGVVAPSACFWQCKDGHVSRP